MIKPKLFPYFRHTPEPEKTIDERKNALLKKLESISLDFLKFCSLKTQFYFIGECRADHLIETNINKEIHGIKSGEFIKLVNGHISLCVGIGPMCEEDLAYLPEKQVIWFLEEGSFGVTYWGESNISTIQEYTKIELI